MPHDPYYQRPTPEPVVSNLGIIVVAVASFVALACLVMLVLGVDLFTSKRRAQLQEKEEVRAAAETPPQKTPGCATPLARPPPCLRPG